MATLCIVELSSYSYEGHSFRYASASSATRAVGTDGAKAVLEAAGSRYRDVDSLGSSGGAPGEGMDGGAGDVTDSTAEAQSRTRYLNAGGRTIGESGRRGSLSYTLDRLGSVRQETGADGQSQSYEYDAYGASIGQTDPTTFGYTGKPVDPVNLIDPNGLKASDAAAAATGVGAPGGIAMLATNNSGGSSVPERITNPKHHPKSDSPEPENVDDLYENSVEDSNGVRGAQDSDGLIHWFSRPSNGQTH